jgi:hypothetical protein
MNYEDWQPTCDTLHAHTQVLGKLATKLAPPEPQLQHAALRLTARGIETLPLRRLTGRALLRSCSTSIDTKPSSSTPTGASDASRSHRTAPSPT